MKFSQPKLRIVVIALIMSSMLVLLPARRAQAYYGGGEAAIVAGIIAVWVTYVTAKGLVCTPVAAFNASKNQNGFVAAFKACWDWEPRSEDTAQSSSVDTVDDSTSALDNTSMNVQVAPSDANEPETEHKAAENI